MAIKQNLDNNEHEYEKDDDVELISTQMPDVVEAIVKDEEEVKDESDLEAERLVNEEIVETPNDKVETSQTDKRLSKEESKIVALKRANQKLLDDYRLVSQKLVDIESGSKHNDIKNEYIDKGIDEDTAERMAKQDMLFKKQEERLELLEFKEDNIDVIRKYPDAKKDLSRIMQNAKVTGMTVEQVCRGLYGEEVSERERRVLNSVTDTEVVQEESTTNVARIASLPTEKRLSQEDLRLKAAFEEAARGGNKMTNNEWIAKKEKYGL